MELPIKIGIISGSIFLFTILFGWVGFPVMFKYGIKSVVTLHPQSELRKMWEKIPFSIDFKVYLFNVTNAKDVQNGDSPVIDEIGPFIYDEWRKKVDIVDNEKEDSVEFNSVMTWYFNQKRSGALTGEELVTIPHPIILPMLLKIANEKPSMLSIAMKAVNVIFDNPETIFLTAKVKDILFDGIYINCNVTDFIANMVCTQLKEEKTMKRVGEHGVLFSFFGYKNDTMEERMKVKRGIENWKDVNRVIEYKNNTELDIWPSKECNKLRGTESTVYPPLISDGEDLAAFVPVLCRPLDIKYVKKTTFRNIPVSYYTTSLGDPAKNKNDRCYCSDENKCYRKGAMDLNKCTGAPIVVTSPHFYNSDSSYLKGVRGLHPQEEKHRMEFYFEPISGTILNARNRLQFNFELQKLRNVSMTENFRNILLPILWIDEGIALNTTYLQKLDSQVFLLIHINDIVKWTLLVISAFGMAIAVYMIAHLKRGFSLSGLHLREQEVEVETIPDKSAVISSLSAMVSIKNKPN